MSFAYFLLFLLPLTSLAWEPWNPQLTEVKVQPMTGIVLWDSSEHIDNFPPETIQLEFFYLNYDAVMKDKGIYDWTAIEDRLERIASRKRQAILRFWDTYPGKKSGVPNYIQKQGDWKGITGLSEGKKTGFPDWSNPLWKSEHLAFFQALAKKYDTDPRVAFLQCGFGLWSEYHLYDGPFELGKTFPDYQYQGQFLKMMADSFKKLPWMISIDAATPEYSPIAEKPQLKDYPFGLFDDSLLLKNHAKWNEKNWNTFGKDRWKRHPAGGELNYESNYDQRTALSKDGPHGESFVSAAQRFHLTFVIGNDQPNYTDHANIAHNAAATGYKFVVRKAEKNGNQARILIENTGVAPLYYDAWLRSATIRSEQSLKGLLPGETREFLLQGVTEEEKLEIECERLVPGQRIGLSKT